MFVFYNEVPRTALKTYKNIKNKKRKFSTDRVAGSREKLAIITTKNEFSAHTVEKSKKALSVARRSFIACLCAMCGLYLLFVIFLVSLGALRQNSPLATGNLVRLCLCVVVS
jgi:hypothetical protein